MNLRSLKRPLSFRSLAVDVALPFAVLLIFLSLGNLLQSMLHTWMPGSVLGMLALLFVLSTGVVQAAVLDRISDWLLDRLGLFFVCPGVEIIRYLDLVGAHWGSLLVAIVGSSVVTIVMTGWVGEGSMSRKDHKEHKDRMEND